MKRLITVLIIIVLVLVSILLFINTKEELNGLKKVNIKSNESKKSVLEHEYYKGLKLENIISIDELKYTEGGLKEKTYNDREDIEKIYNYWKNKKLGKETNKACDDNTTIYVFKLEENVSLSIEKECNVIIIDQKRYLIK